MPDHPERADELPYFEIGDELPQNDPSQVRPAESQMENTLHQTAASPLSVPGQRSDLPTSIRALNRPQRPGGWQNLRIQLSSIPRHYLILLAVSSLIIVALLPQFLVTLGMIALRLLIVMRVLILPLAAIVITLWIIRFFYRRE